MVTKTKRDKDLISFTGFGGLRNNVPAHRFGPKDLEVASNIDIDASGMASLRTGHGSSLYAGAVHSMFAEDDICLFVEASTLKRLSAAYAGSTLRSLTSNARMSFWKVDERVYFSNGTDLGVVEAGGARGWGLPVPPQFLAVATVGYMPAGDYLFTMTYLAADGRESGADECGRITVPTGGGITFTLPVSTHADVAYKAVYLAPANGGDALLRRALLVTNATTIATYANDTTELPGGALLESLMCTAPPAGQLVGYFQGCTYVAVGADVFHSKPYGPEWFDLEEYFSFDSTVTMFAPSEDEGIFFGSEKATYWVPGSGPEAFRQVRKASYGVIPGTLTYIDAGKFGDGSMGERELPMWLSTKGICIGLPGGTVQNLTDAKYSFTAQGSGCALFRSDTSQLIAVANS